MVSVFPPPPVSRPRSRKVYTPSFRSEVYDVVGTLDDFQIVLYDDDRMPTFDEGIEGGQQFPDVVEVQSRGRLVKDEYGGG